MGLPGVPVDRYITMFDVANALVMLEVSNARIAVTGAIPASGETSSTSSPDGFG